VPDLNFHDLRRTAVRNMRRAGISQVIRIKISGTRPTAMERRYNIVDADELQMAKELLRNRRRTPENKGDGVTETVNHAGTIRDTRGYRLSK
jgi:hypothetical protein